MILLHRLTAHNFKQLTDVSLCFPERGTILIEGANEAGKSSLFEAVFFALYGRSLITDKGFQTAQLRKYGEDEMRVELDFSIAGRHFQITRRVGNNQTARLICPALEDKTETLTGIVPIRARLASEMRLSAEAMLNTCFVEQKELGRLEEMNGLDRRNAINELLNLRVLTNLAANYKVTMEDQNGVKLCRSRVDIARLDALLPDLEQAERAAAHCLGYVQMLAEEARWNDLQSQIEAAQSSQEEIAQERKGITAKLEQASRLRQHLHAIDNNLRLLVLAWLEAVTNQRRTREQAAELAALAADLPARRQQLEAWKQLAQNLAVLETLETEGKEQKHLQQDQQAKIDVYKQLQADLETGSLRHKSLRVKHDSAQQTLEEAEQHLKARTAMNLRVPKIVHLLQQITAYDAAVQETGALQSRLKLTHEEIEKLPQRVTRRDQLTSLADRQQQAAQDSEDYRRTKQNLADAQQKRQAREARQTRISTMERDHAAQAQQAKTAQNAEQRATQILHDVKTRLALLDWAEATDHVDQAGASASRLDAVQVRQEKARQVLEERVGQKQQSGKRAIAATGVTGIGSLIGVAGFAAGIALTVTGFVLALAGLVFVAQAMRARHSAQIAEGEARRQCDLLDGECQGAQAAIQLENQQTQQWAQRAADYRRLLEQSGLTVPISSDQARALIVSLPAISLPEAQVACSSAENIHREAASRVYQIEQSLQYERSLAQQEDTTVRPELEETLKTTLTALEQRAKQTEDLPAQRRALEVSEEPNALATAIQIVNREIAASESARDYLPDLQEQHELKIIQANQSAEAIGILATTLELPGKNIAEWKTAANEAQEAIRAAKTSIPDSTLQQTMDQQRETVTVIDRQIAALESEQSGRHEALNKTSLTLLIDDLNILEQNISTNAAEQAVHANVRPALRSSELPTTSLLLAARLAAATESLRWDQERALDLPTVEQTALEATLNTEQRQKELQTAWGESLPTAPIPETSEIAGLQLTPLRADTSRELNEIDEQGLQKTAQELQAKDVMLAGNQRHWKQNQQQARDAQQTLRERLGVPEATCLNDLPALLPELAEVNRYASSALTDSMGTNEMAADLVRWEQAVQERADAIRNNRNRRNLSAEALSLGEMPLDYEVEKSALETTERAIAVKARAGEVVSRTRQSIVNRVMPLTAMNIRLLLPLLTEGRYQDVRWDEEQNTIEVYDQKAREFQHKRVFSGGAKDQISLALRLAFALATLPGEHNIQPGFLFLDEPLSSFDKSRTRALVDLLTRGLICQKFQQVFLVSHSEAFDPACFAHRLRMESGRVIESTL